MKGETLGIYIKAMYQLLFGVFKDKRFPLLIKIVMGCYLLGLFLIALPKIVPILYALSIGLACIAAVLIIGGLLFVFPVFSVISAAIDILFGKRLKNYKQSGNLKYHLPAFTYCLPAMLLILVGTYVENRFVLFDYRNNDYLALCHTIILYMGISAAYVIIFYLGMWRRISHIDSGKYYMEILSKHDKFLKLSIIPLSFLVTLLTVMTAFGDINISLINVMEFIYNILSGMKQNTLQNSIIFMSVLYIFSISVQVIALFVNPIFRYFFEEGKYYKQIGKKSIIAITKIIK